MEIRELGRSGLKVSALGLAAWGCQRFYSGPATMTNRCHIHRALELGINFLDTGGCVRPHKNEELVGKAIRGKRAQVVLATKSDRAGPGQPLVRGVNGKADYVPLFL